MKTLKQKQKQTIVGLVISIICLLMFTTAMTFAYFTARNSAESTAMQFGTLEISVDDVGVTKEAEHELMPGCTVRLAGTITLGDSTIDAFVRIKPEVNITIWNGTSLTKANAQDQLTNLVIGAFEKEENSTKTGDFIRATGDNTYLYYAGKFTPGTTYDFEEESISFKIDENTFGNDWQGAVFTVKITAEAIQADHVGITPEQITTGGQALVNAIAGAKNSIGEQETAWNGIGGNSQEEENNPDAVDSLPYLDFTPVNSDGSEIEGAIPLSDNVNEMPTLNSVNTQVSNLMTDDRKYVSVSVKYGEQPQGNIVIPIYIKKVGNSVEPATSTEWKNNSAYKVISIAEWAFCGYSSLTSITIPNSVTSIGKEAFGSCSKLTSIIVESENATYDNRGNSNAIIETTTNTLIAGCKNTIIPDSVTSIGECAFYGCSLTSIAIPDTVISIGKEAFRHCSDLTSITIPNSVASIGKEAFYGCTSLANVTFGENSGWKVYTYYDDNYDMNNPTELLESDLGNISTAAGYLTNTHCAKYWERSSD